MPGIEKPIGVQEHLEFSTWYRIQKQLVRWSGSFAVANTAARGISLDGRLPVSHSAPRLMAVVEKAP